MSGVNPSPASTNHPLKWATSPAYPPVPSAVWWTWCTLPPEAMPPVQSPTQLPSWLERTLVPQTWALMSLCRWSTLMTTSCVPARRGSELLSVRYVHSALRICTTSPTVSLASQRGGRAPAGTLAALTLVGGPTTP